MLTTCSIAVVPSRKGGNASYRQIRDGLGTGITTIGRNCRRVKKKLDAVTGRGCRRESGIKPDENMASMREEIKSAMISKMFRMDPIPSANKTRFAVPGDSYFLGAEPGKSDRWRAVSVAEERSRGGLRWHRLVSPSVPCPIRKLLRGIARCCWRESEFFLRFS